MSGYKVNYEILVVNYKKSAFSGAVKTAPFLIYHSNTGEAHGKVKSNPKYNISA